MPHLGQIDGTDLAQLQEAWRYQPPDKALADIYASVWPEAAALRE